MRKKLTEIVKEAFKERYGEGVATGEVEEFITEYLVDDSDGKLMTAYGLSVYGILNGRYVINDEPLVISLCKKWNGFAGFPLFAGL